MSLACLLCVCGLLESYSNDPSPYETHNTVPKVTLGALR